MFLIKICKQFSKLYPREAAKTGYFSNGRAIKWAFFAAYRLVKLFEKYDKCNKICLHMLQVPETGLDPRSRFSISSRPKSMLWDLLTNLSTKEITVFGRIFCFKLFLKCLVGQLFYRKFAKSK